MRNTETMTRDDAYKMAAALVTLDEVSGAMLDATGGECGRCFAPAERVVFDAILAAKKAVSNASSEAFKLRALEATVPQQ